MNAFGYDFTLTSLLGILVVMTVAGLAVVVVAVRRLIRDRHDGGADRDADAKSVSDAGHDADDPKRPSRAWSIFMLVWGAAMLIGAVVKALTLFRIIW